MTSSWVKSHPLTRHSKVQLLRSHFVLTLHAYVEVLYKTLRPRQNGRHFPDDIFKCIIMNVNHRQFPDNFTALVQILAWRRSGDRRLSEPMIIILLTQICVTRLQWVNSLRPCDAFMRHHYFRKWLVASSATKHYLNQWLIIAKCIVSNKFIKIRG